MQIAKPRAHHKHFKFLSVKGNLIPPPILPKHTGFHCLLFSQVWHVLNIALRVPMHLQ